jgi:hypothetical protein
VSAFRNHQFSGITLEASQDLAIMCACLHLKFSSVFADHQLTFSQQAHCTLPGPSSMT